MIQQLEPDPAPVIERLITQARLAKTAVGCVQVLEMTGKRHRVDL